ncbi:uncharacterized protein V6R79_021967 [Siganus canaliculatus]
MSTNTFRRWSTAQKTTQSTPRTELHRGNPRLKMLCSRCVLPLLALYMMLEEISAAVLPDKFRNKREVSWLDQEISRLLDLSDQRDLSVGDAGETGRDAGGSLTRSETRLTPAEHLSTKHHNQNQFQYQRKGNEKKRKIAPLDSIGGFQMASFRSRQDEPDNGFDWKGYREE